VVVRVGSSAGVLWEIETALAAIPRQRLVLTVLGAGGGSTIAPEVRARLAAGAIRGGGSAVSSVSPPTARPTRCP
jgi:hypothetical protein